MAPQPKSAGQAAYEAYANHQHWVNYQGLPIPEWLQVRADIQAAWEAGVDAGIAYHEAQHTTEKPGQAADGPSCPVCRQALLELRQTESADYRTLLLWCPTCGACLGAHAIRLLTPG